MEFFIRLSDIRYPFTNAVGSAQLTIYEKYNYVPKHAIPGLHCTIP